MSRAVAWGTIIGGILTSFAAHAAAAQAERAAPIPATALASDAIDRVASKVPVAIVEVRVDLASSAVALGKLGSITGISPAQMRNLASGRVAEAGDSLARCLNRAERKSPLCSRLSSRTALMLFDAQPQPNNAVFIEAGFTAWKGATKPVTGSVTRLLYERAADGTWRFVRVVGGAAG